MKALAILVAILLLLAALVVYAPASLLDGRFSGATSSYVRLSDASGTVWNGRGVLTNATRSWSIPVGWTIDPRSIVRGAPAITLRAAEGGDTPRGDIASRDGAIVLDGVAFTLPAAMLNGSLVPGNMLALGGSMAFDAQHASWSDKGGDGAATLRWSGARLAGSAGALALGTVTVNFAPLSGKPGGRFVGRVENRGGDVRVDGDISLGNADVDVDVTVAPLPSTPPAITRALGNLATPDANGAVRLQWHGGTH